MGAFIEERLNVCVRVGAEAEDSYAVDVVNTAGGSRYASLRHGLPMRTFDVDYVKGQVELVLEIESLFHRTYGGYAGFRVRAWKDFSTANDGMSAPTAFDSPMILVSPGVYRLAKTYGRDKPALPGIGRPVRHLYKPVAGTILIGGGGATYPEFQYTVDTTTGLVTFAANKSRAITAITKAVNAIATVGSNTFAVGESVAISGVVGMTQINGLRALITAKPDANHISLDINSSSFDDYTSGGTIQTQPLAGESVTCGCEFDIPVAFDSNMNTRGMGRGVFDAAGLRLVELLNP